MNDSDWEDDEIRWQEGVWYYDYFKAEKSATPIKNPDLDNWENEPDGDEDRGICRAIGRDSDRDVG